MLSNTLYYLFIVLYVSKDASSHLKLPSYIKPCSKKDPNFNECATKHARQAIPHMIEGDRKYKIPKLDPLLIPELSVDQGTDSRAVGFSFVGKDINIKGGKDVDVQSIKFDLENHNAEFKLHYPRLETECKYSIKGQILLFPITGSGDANLTATDMNIKFKFNYTVEERADGFHYWVIGDTKLDYDILGKLYIDLQNLFNGNEILGQQANIFLNENWRDIGTEIGPLVASAMGETVKLIVQDTMELVPEEESIPIDVPPESD